jgi:hypothetical protein
VKKLPLSTASGEKRHNFKNSPKIGPFTIVKPHLRDIILGRHTIASSEATECARGARPDQRHRGVDGVSRHDPAHTHGAPITRPHKWA